MTVDHTDAAILQALARDGRIPVAELAAAVHISRGTAYSRLTKLHESGVIRRFTIQVDHERLGLGVTALVLLHIGQLKWRSLREELVGMPEVQYAGFLTGGFDAMLFVRTSDMTSLRELLLERLQSLQGVRGTQTLLVMDEATDRTTPLGNIGGTDHLVGD